MLDKLPAQLRHVILIMVGTFLAPFLQAIMVHQGITGVAWHALLVTALNNSIVAGVSSNVLLNLTPLTRQYGAFANPPVAVPDPAAAQELADAKQALVDTQAQLAQATAKLVPQQAA